MSLANGVLLDHHFYQLYFYETHRTQFDVPRYFKWNTSYIVQKEYY